MSPEQSLEDLAVSAISVAELQALTVSAGSVVWLEGDMPNWGSLVSCLASGSEVREFSPEGASWGADEVRSVLGKLRVRATEGVSHVVLSQCETLTPANWDRLLKSLEELRCVVWVCTSTGATVPDTVRGRLSDQVSVVGGFDVRVAAEVLGGEVETVRLLEGAHGLNLLMNTAVRKGLTDQLRLVAASSGSLFDGPVAAMDFLNAFGQLCTGKVGFSATWDWNKESPERKRLVRTELLKWFAVDGVRVTDGASALVSQNVQERYIEVAELLRRNVPPMHAVSACVQN